jgi:HEAT repeat protein
LLITIDALRADRMGVYGHTRRDLTPQLDKWARQEAVIFERAYCPAPHTSYSITSMHTSRYLYQESQLFLPLVYPTIAEVLGNAGYQSEAFYTQGIFFTQGEKVVHYRSTHFGFDKVHHGAPDPGPLTEYAKAAVDRIVAGNRPGFLWVHYFNVHEPYRSTTFGTSPADRYDGEIAQADAGAANLIEYARQRLGDRLIVALSADHGEEFKEHGGDYHGSSLYDEQVRVPLMISAPGLASRRVESAVSTVSLGSTLLGLSGVPVPLSMTGEDLRPAMVTGHRSPRPIFSSVHRKQGIVLLPHKLIVDPTLGTAELYDLHADPQERVNLFDIQRETAARLEGLLYGFMDDLGQVRTWVDAAMNLGKLRDPRAAPDLLRLAMDEDQDLEQRLGALDLLCGLVDRDAASTIAGLLADSNHMIATAAALVLSSAKDPRGACILKEALLDPDPQIRDKASLALATLGDSSAVPTLIDALGRGEMEMRQEAIRALGELRDPEAEDPLIDLLVDIKSKYLVVLALGKIGGPKAYDTLLNVLKTDPYADVRGYAVVGLGWLEDPRAIESLRKVLREDPDIKWTVEALIRLGALGDKGFHGVDARPDDPGLVRGFASCQARPRIVSSEFLGRTTCQTLGPRAELALHSNIDGESTVMISAKHLVDSADEPLPLEISIDGKVLGRVELTRELGTQRLNAPTGSFQKGKHMVRLQLIAEGAWELDHLVVVPAQ